MLRRLMKTGAAAAVHWSGVDKLAALRESARHMPLVLGYHRVVEDFRASSMFTMAPMLTGAPMFERHLDWIGRHYTFVTLDDLAEWAKGDKSFRRPVAAITFDDGYDDIYHHAFPILRRKGIPATVFVVTDLVGTSKLQTHDELYLLLANAYTRWRNPQRELFRFLLDLGIPAPVMRKVGTTARVFSVVAALLDNLPQSAVLRVIDALHTVAVIPEQASKDMQALSWEMLGEMAGPGITVGSHTRSHARLVRETWRTIVEETYSSRALLEYKLGAQVKHFAYPAGIFNAGVVNAVADAGYQCAYTTCRHRDVRHPELTIPRRLLWENSCINALGDFSPSVMSCQVSGVFDFKSSCRQTHNF
jgi:peptidoglycan/xylan/chitin deacetylase (PgdA/CDA1 family)